MGRSIEETIRQVIMLEVRDVILPLIRETIRSEIAQVSRINPDRLITAEEAARVLGMTVSATRKAAQRGSIPARKIGHRLRFRMGDLYGDA